MLSTQYSSPDDAPSSPATATSARRAASRTVRSARSASRSELIRVGSEARHAEPWSGGEERLETLE